MAAAKIIIILCAVFSVAMCFTLPEEQHFNEVQESALSEGEVLARNVRSPDEPKRTVEARGEHNSRHGQSASVTYTHPVGKNIDVYGQVSRQFKYNDNSGHVGIRYKF